MSLPLRIIYKSIDIYYEEDLYTNYIRFFCGRCSKLLGKFNLNVVNDYMRYGIRQETIFDFFRRVDPFLLKHIDAHVIDDEESEAQRIRRKLRLIRRD
jgi:hypothetical protein